MMDRIIRSTEEMLSPATVAVRQSMLGRRSGSYGRAISEAALLAAEEVSCRLIVVITKTGHMARRIAALRPSHRIIALTPVEKTYRQLAGAWGVEPYMIDDASRQIVSMLVAADQALVENQLAERGETVVVMAGRVDDIIISLSMKLHRVGDLT
jgi:pyruvate kinase